MPHSAIKSQHIQLNSSPNHKTQRSLSLNTKSEKTNTRNTMANTHPHRAHGHHTFNSLLVWCPRNLPILVHPQLTRFSSSTFSFCILNRSSISELCALIALVGRLPLSPPTDSKTTLQSTTVLPWCSTRFPRASTIVAVSFELHPASRPG